LPLTELSAHAHGRVAHLSVRDARGEEQSSGSGFLISADGRIATNFHVVDGAENIVAVFPGKREVDVTGVWAFDRDIDLAVLQLQPAKYEALELAQQGAQEGEEIVLIGSPLGLGNAISSGIVSAVREHGIESKDFGDGVASWSLQITAAAAPGSSGGPILRANGEVIGVLVGALGGMEGVHFGIAVEKLRLVAASAPSQLRPLNAASGVRSVRTNLLFSAAGLGALAVVWVAASKLPGFLRRRR
jgi:S1-C subfamily serine protease